MFTKEKKICLSSEREIGQKGSELWEAASAMENAEFCPSACVKGLS